MKKKYIALLVGVLVGGLIAFSAVLFQRYKKDKVPITKAIGLHPVLDETRDRFNRDTVRNVVYKNELSDPQFYSRIVEKVEGCEWVRSKELIRNDDIDGDQFALPGTPYQRAAFHERAGFISKDTKFWCVIYNGTDFVLVVLSCWY